VPQVLAGVLALFGVFVLFKIQSLISQMLTELSEFYTSLEHKHLYFDNDGVTAVSEQVLPELKRGIQSKNITILKEAIDKYAIQIIKHKKEYVIYIQRFNVLNDLYQNIIRNTINSSVFTAIIIIICLAIIPFEKWLICYPFILYISFCAVILSVAIIFYKLISILKKSLKYEPI
jgi:hypothetical protein